MDDEAKRGEKELISDLKSRAKAEGYFIRKLASGRHHMRGGHVRYVSRGIYLDGAVVPVRCHQMMNGGTGTCLISRRLHPLSLVTLFTGRWQEKEQETRQTGEEE